MKVEIKIPPVGESVTEATIATILKPSGSSVAADEEIIELETDKVNQIIYAPAQGVLEIRVKVGDVVKVGQVVGSISTDKTAGAPAAEKAPPKKEEAKPPSQRKEEGGIRQKESDYLKELGKRPEERGLGVEQKPSGKPPEMPKAPEKTVPQASERAVSERGERREKMSKLRRIIAKRLMEVKSETAMLTTFNEADMSAVIEVRKREQENFQKRHGVKLGFTSFFVKACVAALQEYPDINACIEGEEIVYWDYYDIGIAVATEKGLMVPVLRNCEKSSFSQIESQLKEFAEKARAGTISAGDLKGGTFTITNGGVYGSLLSTPILNPPQSGILGMHSIQERPVAIKGKVEIRPMMYLALSYDHRIVDGKEAISFLVHVKKNLEDPTRLLLDL